MNSILLVEDDPALVKGLVYALEKEGFSVNIAINAAEGDKAFRKDAYDLILLDINLPDGNGVDLCSSWRSISRTPIIFLTACDDEVSIVMGLDCGGDDYVTKPFRINELISRIHAVLRRTSKREKETDHIRSADILLDRKSSRLWKNGSDLELTATEFRLVSLLLENRGSVVTRQRLMERIWDRDEHYVDGNTLSVYIRRLREKLEEASEDRQYIETVRGMGYRWIV